MADREGCVQSVSVVVILMDFDFLVSNSTGFCVVLVTSYFPCVMLTSCGSGHCWGSQPSMSTVWSSMSVASSNMSPGKIILLAFTDMSLLLGCVVDCEEPVSG